MGLPITNHAADQDFKVLTIAPFGFDVVISTSAGVVDLSGTSWTAIVYTVPGTGTEAATGTAELATDGTDGALRVDFTADNMSALQRGTRYWLGLRDVTNDRWYMSGEFVATDGPEDATAGPGSVSLTADTATVALTVTGATTGGGSGLSNVVEDTTPQLGGDLDLNDNVITGLEIGTDVQAWDAVLDATTASFTADDETKLDGIESGADVTDAANVAAAGAAIITSGAGAPGSTPAKVGDIYVDTTADRTYVATDTASSADWDIVPAGGPSLTGVTDADNTLLGSGAGTSITTATDNVAVGENALNAATANASRNVAIGAQALAVADNVSTTDATGNVAVGYTAGAAMTTGRENTLIGANTGKTQETTSESTFVGYDAGQGTTGGSNTFVGHSAGEWVGGGGNNTAVGRGALNGSGGSPSSGSNNVAVGKSSLFAITTGTGNTAVGTLALGSVTASGNNVAVGNSALSSSTGSENLAVGKGAGTTPGLLIANATTTGSRNIFIGNDSGFGSAAQREGTIVVGRRGLVDGNYAIAIGNGASAGAAGAIAIGVDSGGAAASTTTANEIKLGTANHAVNIPGTLKVKTPATYSETNVSTDRAFDADTVAVAELADVVGTLIADLRTIGLVV